MPKVITILCILCLSSIPGRATACKPSPNSSWYWSEEKLILNAKTILVVKVLERTAFGNNKSLYKAKILKIVKGESAVDHISFKLLDGGKESKAALPVRMDKSCELSGVLEIGMQYIVFPENMKNSLAIQRVESDVDDKVIKVENVLNKK